MIRIKPNELANYLEGELAAYHKDIVDGIKKETNKSMLKLVKKTKEQQFKQDTGEYRKHITSKTVWEDTRGITKVWYVRAPHYRLTHLLENGHAKKNGGRTVAYHFVRDAANEVKSEYLANVEKVIKNGG